MSWTITFADGTELAGLEKNGTNYISAAELDTSVMTDENCSPITFTDVDGDGGSETWEHGSLVQQVYYDGTLGRAEGWHICFRQRTDAEVKAAETADEITALELALVEVYEASLAASESTTTETETATEEA